MTVKEMVEWGLALWQSWLKLAEMVESVELLMSIQQTEDL